MVQNHATLDLIKNRRATRHFDPAYKMSLSEIQELIETARFAPTAFNLQNVRFVIVEDMKVRKQIREIAWDQPQVTDASALIVMTADVEAWKKDVARCWKDAPEKVRNLYANELIPGYYKGRPEVQRDEAFRSASLASYALMLTAEASGLHSCPMDGFDFAKLAKIIDLPKDHVIVMMLAIGKRAKDPEPRPGVLRTKELIRINRF